MSKQSERRRRFVRAFAPAVGLLAAGLLVWQGSYAAFSATTTDSGNAWATGTMQLENNGSGSYSGTASDTFGSTDMVPGDTGSACVTVKDTGSVGGDLALYGAAATGSNASLEAQLHVTVDAVALASTDADVKADCTGWSGTGATTVLADTALTGVPADYASATTTPIAGSDGRVAYKLTWTFVSTGTTTGDNNLQGVTATEDFTWEVQ